MSKIIRLGTSIRATKKSFRFFCTGHILKTKCAKKSSYRSFFEKSTPTPCAAAPVTLATTDWQGVLRSHRRQLGVSQAEGRPGRGFMLVVHCIHNLLLANKSPQNLVA